MQPYNLPFALLILILLLPACTTPALKSVHAPDYWDCDKLFTEIESQSSTITDGRYFFERKPNVLQVTHCFGTPEWYSAGVLIGWGWSYRFELWYPTQGIVLVFGASESFSDVIETIVGQPTPTPQTYSDPLVLNIVQDLPLQWIVKVQSNDSLADFVRSLGDGQLGLIGVSQTEDNNFELRQWDGWSQIVVIDEWSRFRAMIEEN